MKRIDPSCDKKVPEEKIRSAAMINGLSSSIDEFSFEILNGDSSGEFVDTCEYTRIPNRNLNDSTEVNHQY